MQAFKIMKNSKQYNSDRTMVGFAEVNDVGLRRVVVSDGKSVWEEVRASLPEQVRHLR